MRENNLQAIYVMWIREIKRLYRAKSRMLGTITMPLFFLLAMGFGFRTKMSFPGIPSNISYIEFLVPGIIGMSLIFNSMITGVSVLWDREFGFLKEIMVAPVKRWVIVVGRILGGITTAFFQGLLILFISFFMGFKIVNLIGLLYAFVFMILIGISFTSLGIAIASIVTDIQGFPMIMQIIIFPTFLLSGAIFPIDNLPNWLKFVVYLNPLTYGVDGLRYSLISFSQFSPIIDLSILLVFNFVIISLATFLFSNSEV